MRTKPIPLPMCVLALALGCGPTGLEKVIVEGNVTYSGNPIENGEIRFHPTDGTTGPVSGAPIVDGRYKAVAKGGVPVGYHIVRIIGYKVTGSADDDMLTAGKSGGGRSNYVPSKYNQESVLRLEVPDSSSQMTKDFELAK